MIRLVVRLLERHPEVLAHALERRSQHLPHPLRDHTSAIFRGEDQMRVQLENDMSAASKVT
jgi:hypothetical protein